MIYGVPSSPAFSYTPTMLHLGGVESRLNKPLKHTEDW